MLWQLLGYFNIMSKMLTECVIRCWSSLSKSYLRSFGWLVNLIRYVNEQGEDIASNTKIFFSFTVKGSTDSSLHPISRRKITPAILRKLAGRPS
jgi:hypothetical protein